MVRTLGVLFMFVSIRNISGILPPFLTLFICSYFRTVFRTY
jgi:hypothetical protein